jgi:BASS family bile acid:Na+ symporter
LVPNKSGLRGSPDFAANNRQIITLLLRIDYLGKMMMKSISLLAAILLGILFPQLHLFSELINYLLSLNLFFSFLSIKVGIFYKNAFLVVLANISIPIAFYFIVLPFNAELAFIAFLTAITPTALASPTVAKFLNLNVEYVTFSVILSNSLVAIVLPLVLPLLIRQTHPISTITIFLSICQLFLIPLLLAQAVKLIIPRLSNFLLKLKNLPFLIWIILILITSAKSTDFILHSGIQPIKIAVIALISLIICAVNFTIGKLIGGKQFSREASQSLGQKNTMFTIWVSLTFLTPIVALGPIFYIIYHNLYNSYQLMKNDNLGTRSN